MIETHKIIAIIRGVKNELLFPLADVLYESGIKLVEVTINQSGEISDTLKAVCGLTERFNGKMGIGAGTVMTAAQAEAVIDAGAKYIISPNTSREVIERTKELGIVSIPGAFTPTEIAAAYSYGADYVKIFPVNAVGPEYIKAVKAPLSHIPLLAVGGIDADNITDYLDAGARGVGAGSALTNVNTPKDELYKIARNMVGKIAMAFA